MELLMELLKESSVSTPSIIRTMTLSQLLEIESSSFTSSSFKLTLSVSCLIGGFVGRCDVANLLPIQVCHAQSVRPQHDHEHSHDALEYHAPQLVPTAIARSRQYKKYPSHDRQTQHHPYAPIDPQDEIPEALSMTDARQGDVHPDQCGEGREVVGAR